MKEISKALLKAQGEVTKIIKDAKNPHFKNDYASLPNILSNALPALRANNILFTVSAIQKDGNNFTQVRLIHVESGEMLESHLPILNVSDSQKMGGCITYNERYGLLPLMGLAADIDDDGNKASDRDIEEIQKKQKILDKMVKEFSYDKKIEVYIKKLIENKDVTTKDLDYAISKLTELAKKEGADATN